MQKTTNYNLNQWEAADRVTREEINADNAKIDAALGTMPRIATGNYKGTGSASCGVTLPFVPKLFLCGSSTSSSEYFIWFTGISSVAMSGMASVMPISLSGTRLTWNGGGAAYSYNLTSFTYHWIAIG